MDTEKLINEILRNSWSGFNHKKLKSEFSIFLRNKDFSVICGYPIKNETCGKRYIDLIAYHTLSKFSIGIEIDNASPRFRSVENLKLFRPDLALFILKSNQVPRDKIWQKVCKFPFKFAVLNLFSRCVVLPSLSHPLKSNKTYRAEEIRRQYPSAYAEWTTNEDKRLINLYMQDESIKNMSAIFKRQPSAIRSRLNKLNKNYYKFCVYNAHQK